MTLYAGNSLTGAIYKGSELICQTGGGEGDITVDFGNEMLRANAWTSYENGRGKAQFAYCTTANGSNMIKSDLYPVSSNILIDPALFSYASNTNLDFLNEDGLQIRLTANTSTSTITESYPAGGNSYTGFAHASFVSTGKPAIRDGKVYASGNNAKTKTSPGETVISFISYENGSGPGIINDKLAINGTTFDSNYTWQGVNTTNTNTTAWTCVANNRLVRRTLSGGAIVMSDFTVNPEKTWLNALWTYQDNYAYKISYTNGSFSIAYTITFDHNIRDINASSPYVWFLLENDELYVIDISNRNPIKKATNIKQICFKHMEYRGYYLICLTNDNKIKRVVSDSSTITDLTSAFFPSGGTFEMIKTLRSSRTITNCAWFAFYYPEDITLETGTVYTTPNSPNYAYISINNNIEKVAITSLSGNTLIANNKTYIRTGSKDTIFNFIPDEFENRLYTDQDIALTAMTAALKYR